ncbi:MAG: CRTAC1 family protein, partial [Planctomycetes bacterium]|nr:CRTAC1 family protein [Planctomycetota bacterium]
LGVVLVDLNQDGKPDIYVANDMTAKFLYFNVSTPGKLKFVERALESGTACNDCGDPDGSMGVDAGDYDRSGLPHLFVTNFENDRHALYHNDWRPGLPVEKHFFSYRSAAAGITAIGRSFVSWGTGFVDVENGGWEDLFIVSGHTLRHPARLHRSSRKQRAVLLRNLGDGRFRDMSKRGGAYFDDVHLARGLALGDLNNDGRVDAVISHINDPVVILKNVAAPDNHWLGVELVGAKFRDVVGARLSLEAGGRTQWRFAKGCGSYLSARDPRHVFGLGKENKVGRLTVIWPDGKEQHWDHLPIDRYYRLMQGQERAEEQAPGRR